MNDDIKVIGRETGVSSYFKDVKQDPASMNEALGNGLRGKLGDKKKEVCSGLRAQIQERIEENRKALAKITTNQAATPSAQPGDRPGDSPGLD